MTASLYLGVVHPKQIYSEHRVMLTVYVFHVDLCLMKLDSMCEWFISQNDKDQTSRVPNVVTLRSYVYAFVGVRKRRNVCFYIPKYYPSSPWIPKRKEKEDNLKIMVASTLIHFIVYLIVQLCIRALTFRSLVTIDTKLLYKWIQKQQTFIYTTIHFIHT